MLGLCVQHINSWMRGKAASYVSPGVGLVKSGYLQFYLVTCELCFTCSQLCGWHQSKQYPNTGFLQVRGKGYGVKSQLRTFPEFRSIPMPNFTEISPVVWISIVYTHTHTYWGTPHIGFYTLDLPNQGPIIHYVFVIYGIRSELVCFSKPVKVTNNRKDTSLLWNLSIFCKLQVRNVL